jgi:hypothetical protein
MATHAPTPNATLPTPLFSLPTPPLHAAGIPHWRGLDPDLQQALVGLLTRMIGNHLPSARVRDERGDADDPR